MTTSDDKTVRVWHLETHRLVALRKLPRASRSVALSHDGSTIVIGSLDGSLLVFPFAEVVCKVSTRKQQSQLSPHATPLPHTPMHPQLATVPEPIATLHHRKENISDIKFAPATDEVITRGPIFFVHLSLPSHHTVAWYFRFHESLRHPPRTESRRASCGCCQQRQLC